MDNTPKRDAPNEMQIEEMLSRFKPQPTARFFAMMENAPWQTTTHHVSTRWYRTWKPAHKLIWGLVGLLLIFTVLCLVFFPQVRAIARQIYFSFVTSNSDQLEVQVTLSSPGDLFHFSDPANFLLSINEVQQQAGFHVREITLLSDKLSFTGARFDPYSDATTLLYQGIDYILFLTQRPLGNGQDVFSIGANAKVNTVKIGSSEGEFVTGGWKAVSTQLTNENQTPASQIIVNAIWDSSLPQYTLRWQETDFVYELRTVGQGSPSQTDLIKLANELK
jgi:hypothetical protein